MLGEIFILFQLNRKDLFYVLKTVPEINFKLHRLVWKCLGFVRILKLCLGFYE